MTDDLTRALATRGRLAELADEVKALDKVSKKSRNPGELKACAARAAEIAAETQRLQGFAVREAGRLLKEMQAVPGFSLDLFLGDQRVALGALMAARQKHTAEGKS
jgi:hypothetical protein